MKNLVIHYKVWENKYRLYEGPLFKEYTNPYSIFWKKNYVALYRAFYQRVPVELATRFEKAIQVPNDLTVTDAWFMDLVVKLLPSGAFDITIVEVSEQDAARKTKKPINFKLAEE